MKTVRFLFLSLLSISFFITAIAGSQILKTPLKKDNSNIQDNPEIKPLISKSEKYYISKNYDSSSLILKQVLELTPDNEKALYYYSLVLIEQKEYQKSKECCVKGMKYETAFYENFAANLAICYMKLDELDSALQLLNEAMQKYPLNSKMHYALGVVQMRKADYQKAEESLVYSILLNPWEQMGHFEISKLYEKINEHIIETITLITFLTLEPNTTYSQEAHKMLDYIDKLYRNNDNTIYLSSDNLLNNSPFMTLELAIKLSITADNINKSGRKSFELKKNRYMLILSLIQKSYDEDFEKYKEQLFFRIYYKFLGDIHRAGYSEVFAYYIFSGSKYPEVKEWLDENEEKVEEFRKWVDDYQW